MSDDEQRDFMAQAAGPRTTLLGELTSFLRENKKWWIAPILISIVLLGLVVILAGTGAAPFIYTLF
jgi:hypothetical protein